MQIFKVKFIIIIIIIGPYSIFVRNLVFIAQEQILYAPSPLYMTLHLHIVAKSLIL
jgi:hypothetical protein